MYGALSALMNRDSSARDRRDIHQAAHDHIPRQLVLNELDQELYAIGAVGRQAPEGRPSHQHALCSKRERLEHIASPGEPAIDQYRCLATDGVDDSRQSENRGGRTWGGAAGVVGDDDPLKALGDSRLGLFRRHDSLEDDGNLYTLPDTLDGVPVREPRFGISTWRNSGCDD